MIKKLDERLKIELINNKITNVDDILLNIPKINDYEMLKEYYEFINQNIDIKLYDNLEVILFALNSRINQLESKIKVKEELENAKKLNHTLERISLMENPKEYNNAKKDMLYLKYINEDGTLTILEISNNEKLLQLLTTIAPTTNSNDFIKLLRSRYFVDLPTFGMGKDQISILELENSSVIIDKANFKMEKEILKEEYPDYVPKVSIDSNRERLYHVGKQVIKFHDEDGRRQKVIISDDKKPEIVQENQITKDTQIYNQYNSEVNITISRGEIEDITVETDEASPLIQKYVTGKSLEKSEQLKAYAFLNSLLSILETDFEVTNYEEQLLGVFIDYIREKDKKMLCNNIEKEFLNRYNLYHQKLAESASKNANIQTKKYTNYQTAPLIIDDQGASLTIIIITVTVLLGALIAALLLVK